MVRFPGYRSPEARLVAPQFVLLSGRDGIVIAGERRGAGIAEAWRTMVETPAAGGMARRHTVTVLRPAAMPGDLLRGACEVHVEMAEVAPGAAWRDHVPLRHAAYRTADLAAAARLGLEVIGLADGGPAWQPCLVPDVWDIDGILQEVASARFGIARPGAASPFPDGVTEDIRLLVRVAPGPGGGLLAELEGMPVLPGGRPWQRRIRPPAARPERLLTLALEAALAGAGRAARAPRASAVPAWGGSFPELRRAAEAAALRAI